MAGTVSGGKKTAQTNKQRYGDDHYAKLGAIGGKKGHTGGFAYMKSHGQLDKVRAAGKKGGSISKRGKTVKPVITQDTRKWWQKLFSRTKTV